VATVPVLQPVPHVATALGAPRPYAILLGSRKNAAGHGA